MIEERRCLNIAQMVQTWRSCATSFGVCCAILISSSNAWPETGPHANWTSAERGAWAQLHSSGRVELAPADDLPSDFLRDITTDPDLTKELVNGATIRGGRIVGALNLRSVKVSLPLVELETTFPAVVDISDSIFDGTLSFKNSDLSGGIIATRSHIVGSLIFGKYDDAEFIGSRSSGGNKIYQLSASHIRVDGDIVLSGATIERGIDFSLSNIKGTLSIMYVDDQSADISATEVGNQLIVFSTILRQSMGPNSPATLNFYSSRAERGLYITRTTLAGLLSVEAAIISGDLDLLGSTLTSVDAKSAQVTGYLIVGENPIPPMTPTNWLGDSLLDLDGSHLGGVRAPEDEADWPSRILFHASTLGLFYSDFCGRPNCSHSPVWFQTWLRHAADDPPSIEPYKQISDMLSAEGRVREARELSVTGHDVEKDAAWRTHQWFRYALYWLYGISVGYGSYPERSLLWICILTGVGAVVFRRTPEAKAAQMPFGIAYSFDMLLPIVHLREAHYKIDLSGWERYYFYLHKLMGWALGLLLAAVMSGLTK